MSQGKNMQTWIKQYWCTKRSFAQTIWTSNIILNDNKKYIPCQNSYVKKWMKNEMKMKMKKNKTKHRKHDPICQCQAPATRWQYKLCLILSSWRTKLAAPQTVEEERKWLWQLFGADVSVCPSASESSAKFLLLSLVQAAHTGLVSTMFSLK